MPQVFQPEVVASRRIRSVEGSAVAPQSVASVADTQPQVAALAQASVRDYEEFRDGSGVLRERHGKQTDGKYGVRIWNSAGLLQIDNTYT